MAPRPAFQGRWVVVVVVNMAEAAEDTIKFRPGTPGGSWWALVTWALPWEPNSLFSVILKGPPLWLVEGAVLLAP